MPVAPGLRVSHPSGQLDAAESQVLSVGRAPDASLRIDDPTVSRHHLELRVREGHWELIDQGSSYGTWVNGQRVERLWITEPVTVHLGQPDRGPRLDLTLLVGAPPVGAPPPVTGPPPPPPAPPRPSAPITGGLRAAETVVVGPAAFRIGRAADNDLVLDDVLVSRRHAELAPTPDGRHRLIDLDSFNGTFVNGQRVRDVLISEADRITVGQHQLRLREGHLEAAIDSVDVTFAAIGITVTVDEGTVLVDEVSFALDRSSLLAVVGPSGSGKSTLLNALSGLRPASMGSVFVGGRDLYTDYADLRSRIGYVPQDDLVHPELTVRQSLEYAAELRFSPDVSSEERRQRVDEVMAELELSERADLVIRRLSGGQRKRVSVALELLTRPSLLFLDEPTSGLDPGLERSLMELLRRLADGGRTVIVVTHSVDSLDLCDRLLCLAPGGSTAYFGPPRDTTTFFGRDDYQQVFRDLGHTDAATAKARYLQHDFADRYVRAPLADYRPDPSATSSGSDIRGQSWFRQFSMLTRRYVRVLSSDRIAMWIAFGGAVVLGFLQWWRLPENALELLDSDQLRVVSQAPLVLYTLILAITQLGLASGIREVVREQSIFRRERAVGLSVSAYIASKVVVLSVITMTQAMIIVPIALARQNGPKSAAALGWPMGEMILAVGLAGIAAMALALLVSASVNSTTSALTLLPTILILQVTLGSGGVFPDGNEKPVLREASYAVSSQWGFAATGATVELNQLQAVNTLARQIPILDLNDENAFDNVTIEDDRGEPRWNHEPRAWYTNMLALLLITAACVVSAGLVLRRFDPV